MANPSKRKGTAHESAVVHLLQVVGFDADRMPLSGNKDRGDIRGVKGWTIECKDTGLVGLAAAMDEARREAVNNGTADYCVVMKRRGSAIGRAYVIQELDSWATREYLRAGL